MGNRGLVVRHDITIEGEHAWCSNGFQRHWDYRGADPVSEAHLHISHALRSVKCICEPGKDGAVHRHCPVHRSADNG